MVLGGTICGALKVWDLANCNELQTIQLFSTPILWMSTINQDKLIVQARFDVSVRVFEMEVYGVQRTDRTKLNILTIGKIH